MTTKQLSYKSLPSLAIAEGATTPDLGVDAKGAWAWSTTLACPVYWNGAKWFASTPNPFIQAISPLDGFNVNITQNNKKTWLLLLPNSTLALGTITLPNAETSTDGQEIRVTSTQQVTKLNIALNGATAVFGAPSVLSADDCFELGYVKSTNSWYKI